MGPGNWLEAVSEAINFVVFVVFFLNLFFKEAGQDTRDRQVEKKVNKLIRKESR